jgi:hypothetical protein
MSNGTSGTLPFVEDVLFQCIYAVGCGAQMSIDRNALKELLEKVRPAFTTTLVTGPSPIGLPAGAPRWDPVKGFILNCSEAIGRLAAQKAAADGKLSIENSHLMEAYHKVRTSNGGLPGNAFCPL